MTQTDKQNDIHGPAQAERHHRSMWRLTAVGLVIATVSALAGVLALIDFGGSDPGPERTALPVGSAAGGSSNAPLTTGSASSSTNVTFLSTLTPQAGSANLTDLPRALRNDQGFARAITIKCPSNNSTDQVREVTYSLRGRYVEFFATVQPVSAAEPDARVYVYAVAAYREVDDTLTRRTMGQQLNTTGQATGPISADVERAEELTLQVRCESPEAVVIINAGRLVHA